MVSIAEMEAEIEEAEGAAAQGELVEKLLKNREFRKVILEGFMGSEVARYIVVSTDHDLSEATRADALGMAQAAGYLKRWLVAQEQLGRQAESKISFAKREIELMRAEEQEGPTTGLED